MLCSEMKLIALHQILSLPPNIQILNMPLFLYDGGTNSLPVYYLVFSCYTINAYYGEHLYQSQKTTSRNCWGCRSLVVCLLQYLCMCCVSLFVM